VIKKIKEIALPTWCQIALVGALISAGGLLFAQTNFRSSPSHFSKTIDKHFWELF